MGENNGPRVVFWVMLLLAWPFVIWQVICIFNKTPVPRLGRNLGLEPIVLMNNGVVDQAAVKQAWQTVGMFAALFLVITVIAWMHSYYQGRRYQ